MPIRLLFLNTRDRCGADVAVHLTLMRHLPPDEVRVFVISNSEAADAEEMRAVFAGMPHVTCCFLPMGRPAEAVAAKSLPARALSYLPSMASLARAAAFIGRHDIQIIHATDRPRDASYASLLGRLTRARTVVHMHAPATHLSRPTLWGMRNAFALFAVSEAVRCDLIRLGLDPQRIFTLHNAVDTDFFHPAWKPAVPASIRSRFGMPADARVAGIVARLNPWKGHYELIGALSLLRDAIPDLHVLIVGADVPEMRRELEQRARQGGVAQRVHFAGFHGDVRPILQELDLFVHPSYGEPFGLSIVEAMAMEKPVIACGTGGVPEIITHGQDGWLVEERSSQAVADAISTLLADPGLCRQLGSRARASACRRFTPRHQSAVVTQFYGRLIESSGLAVTI